MTDQPTTPTVDTDEVGACANCGEPIHLCVPPWTPGWFHTATAHRWCRLPAEPRDFDEMGKSIVPDEHTGMARPVPAAPAEPGATEVAELFHTTYERLAPGFGYRTRDASAVPWADVPEANKALMIATATVVLAALAASPAPADEGREYGGACHVEAVSPRLCEVGTKGCVTAHLPAAPPAAVPEERDEDESWKATPGLPAFFRRSMTKMVAAGGVPEGVHRFVYLDLDSGKRTTGFIRYGANPTEHVGAVRSYITHPYHRAVDHVIATECDDVYGVLDGTIALPHARPAPVTAAPTEEEAP